MGVRCEGPKEAEEEGEGFWAVAAEGGCILRALCATGLQNIAQL